MKQRIDLDLATNPISRGSITRKKGSQKLYVNFRYLGRRIEKSSGLKDTPDNRKKLRIWLNRVMDRIDGAWHLLKEMGVKPAFE